MQTPIPCLFMRGGTSKGPFFKESDLPADISTRDTLFLYYSLYVLAGIIFNFAAEGVMTLLFPSVVHQVSDYLIYGGIGANILVYSEFSRKLFFSVAGSWSLRYMRVLSLLGFLTMAAVPLGFYPLIAPLFNLPVIRPFSYYPLLFQRRTM